MDSPENEPKSEQEPTSPRGPSQSASASVDARNQQSPLNRPPSTTEDTEIPTAERSPSVKHEENSNPSQPEIPPPETTTFGPIDRADVRIVAGEGPDKQYFELNAGALASTSAEWDKILPHPATYVSSPHGSGTGKLSIVLPSVHPPAMRIILHACHFEYDRVPTKVSLELLYNIASSISSFHMGSILTKFAPAWLAEIQQTAGVPSTDVQHSQSSHKAGRKRKHDELQEDPASASKSSRLATSVSTPPSRAGTSACNTEEASTEWTATGDMDSGVHQSVVISEDTRGDVSNPSAFIPNSDRVLLIAWELGDAKLFLCCVRSIVNDSFLCIEGDVVGPSNVVLTGHMYNARMMGIIDLIIRVRADIIANVFKTLNNMEQALLDSSSCVKEDSTPAGKEYCSAILLGGFRKFLNRYPVFNYLKNPDDYRGTVRQLMVALREGGPLRQRTKHVVCNVFADAVAKIEDFHMDAMRSLALSHEQLRHLDLR